MAFFIVPMRTRRFFYTATGGTIGSGVTGAGPRDVDPAAQDTLLTTLGQVPYTSYEAFPVRASGDSSDHPRVDILELGKTVVHYAGQKDGVIISYGTDTMNLAAPTLALMGNEMWRYPVVFLGSIKGPEKVGSDAPVNTLTAGIFAAHGDGSGVFAVRPNGVIITSRHDTPSGAVDWHTRHYAKNFRRPGSFQLAPRWQEGTEVDQRRYEERTRSYFARVKLEELLDSGGAIRAVERRRRQDPFKYIRDAIEYFREVRDGTLDYADTKVVGGRGRVPLPHLLGYGSERMKELKRRPTNDSPSRIANDIETLIDTMNLKGRVVGRIPHYFMLVENLRRQRDKRTLLEREHLMGVFGILLAREGGYSPQMVRTITEFWEEYSGVPNDDLDFSGILSLKSSTDPILLQTIIDRTGGDLSGMIIQATGSAGLRMKDPVESYRHPLAACRESGIPVVLVSSSRGEVTSIEYGPHYRLFDEDLVFFGGTFDDDLVQPRMALMNHPENRMFLEKLVRTLPTRERRKHDIERNIKRQLLSGSHYAKPDVKATGKSDRQQVEDRYHIETRIDLLSSMHAKKAILTAFLHMCDKKRIPIQQDVIGVLNAA